MNCIQLQAQSRNKIAVAGQSTLRNNGGDGPTQLIKDIVGTDGSDVYEWIGRNGIDCALVGEVAAAIVENAIGQIPKIDNH